MHLTQINFTEAVVGRHACSVLNLAAQLAAKGDDSLVKRIRNIPPSKIDVTQEGRLEGRRKGMWLKKAGLAPFDLHATSRYLRAIQTAHCMDLGATWRLDERLNERNWGLLDTMSPREALKRWPKWKEEHEANPFHWTPPHGEPLSSKARAVFDFLSETNQVSHGKRILIVGHRDTNICAQMCIERIAPERLQVVHPILCMENATMIHYRKDASGRLWRRTINPHTDIVSRWKKVRA